MGFKFLSDQLITPMLPVSRGQTASIWCVLMQMDVGTERWRVQVTDSSPSPSCPPTPSVTLAMSRVPSPPPPAEMSSGPVAESWCYTQVKWPHAEHCLLNSKINWRLSAFAEFLFIYIHPSDQSGEVLLHVDHQQLQLLSWGDGRGHQELHLLFWGQWQAEMVSGEREPLQYLLHLLCCTGSGLLRVCRQSHPVWWVLQIPTSLLLALCLVKAF